MKISLPLSLILPENRIWLGSAESMAMLESYQERMFALLEEPPENLLLRYEKWEDEDKEETHPMVQVQDGAAVISVSGPLITGHAGFWGMFFGYTGYEDIKDAVMFAKEHAPKGAVIDYDTPGGSSRGVSETSRFLSRESQDYELRSHTSGTAASAGLWLYTSTKKRTATREAELGSVGVLALYTEYTKADEMRGVTRNLFKSSPLKAAGNPYEKMTKEQAKALQGNVDQMSGFFVDAIADNTEQSRDFVDKNIATGEVWYGEDARKLGLTNELREFDEVFLAIVEKTSDNKIDSGNNQGSQMKKFSKKALELLKTGDLTEDEVVAQLGDEAYETKPSTTQASSEETEEKETEEKETEEKETSSEETEGAEATDYVDKLLTLTQENGDLKTKVASLEAQVEELSTFKEAKEKELEASLTTSKGMRAVVETAVQVLNMKLGKGLLAESVMQGLSDSALLETHQTLQTDFEAIMPVGQKTKGATTERGEDTISPEVQAHNDAVMKASAIL